MTTNLETVNGILKKASNDFGSNLAVAVTDGGPELSYKELEEFVESFALNLTELGILSGDVVSLSFVNTVEFVVAFLGVTRARAVSAPLNSAYTEDEFKFYLEDAQSKLLLLPLVNPSQAAKSAAENLGIPVAFCNPYSPGDGVKLSPAPSSAKSTPPVPFPVQSDEALFLHTSGTTSRPKGVPLTQGNLAYSVGTISSTYELSPTDRTLVVMPLFHVHGIMSSLLATLATGGAVVLPAAGKFSARSFWHDVATAGVTWYTAVPTIHQILLSRIRDGTDPPAGLPLPKLRFVRSCSASLAPAVLLGLEAALSCPVLEAYAMTEASHQMCANPLSHHGARKPGTVGLPTGCQLAILDGTGKHLPAGQVGEVCVNGQSITKGYRNNASANEEAFRYGWFHTGDMGKLDGDGYLTLTGRIKEIINRGGEKISPLEVDSALMSIPEVSEAVSFAAPDAHYGEVVNAAVVLRPGVSVTEDEVKQALKSSLAPFKIPQRIFFAAQVPKTATGKIQRRFVAQHFLEAVAKATGGPKESAVTGASIAALSLAKLGVRHMFGVVGIPVTQLATSAQEAGVRFLGFRNEQSAGYAASATGYLTGIPGVLLTVSGPGVVHGLSGLANSASNHWPMLMISGSCSQDGVGKGDFQEMDQEAAVRPFVKLSRKVKAVSEIPSAVRDAVLASLEGNPGASYVDIPSDVLRGSIPQETSQKLLASLQPVPPIFSLPQAALSPDYGALSPAKPSREDLGRALALLRGAERPLVVFGKGACYSRAEEQGLGLVEGLNLPFLCTPMAKGILPDSHGNSAAAARSYAMAGADVAVVVGARLNWILHFGEAPKWSSTVKFVMITVDSEELSVRKPEVGLLGDARATIADLLDLWKEDPFIFPDSDWMKTIQEKSTVNSAKLEAKLLPEMVPMNFHCSLGIIRNAIAAVGAPPPILVSEGANTMDFGRLILPQEEPRTRLDAGTHGTMGVGLGYAIAAAVTSPGRLVIALEGDSAFGFSGMEVETIVRYKLPVVIIVMNNNGVYGGDRRGAVQLPEETRNDPAPTAFVPEARYDLLMEAFGGRGVCVATPAELRSAVGAAFSERKPCLINVVIDPFAGSESGGLAHKN